MREILFKAKRIDNGKWVVGYYCKWLKGERIITYSEKETDCIITWMSNGGMSRYEVDPETLCQFTGLCDRYGNKIWENDIVTCQTRYGGDIGKVVFHNGKFCVLRNSTYHYSRNGECENYYNINTKNSVKGNVFDNPELLQEEHK